MINQKENEAALQKASKDAQNRKLEDKMERWVKCVLDKAENYTAFIACRDGMNIRAEHILTGKACPIHRFYLAVRDKKGKLQLSKAWDVEAGADLEEIPEIEIVIKDDMKIICHIGDEFFSCGVGDSYEKIILMYSSDKVTNQSYFGFDGNSSHVDYWVTGTLEQRKVSDSFIFAAIQKQAESGETW